MRQQLTILLMLLSVFFVSCGEDNFDMALAPEVTMGEITDIHRTGAVLSANISRSEGRSITESGFILSTFNDFSGMTLNDIRNSSACIVITSDKPVTTGRMSLGVTGLQTKTRYYCCAFVSSGYSVARSEITEFSTVASSMPMFTDIVFSDLTVSSCKASFQLLDIGGEDAVQTLELWYKPVGASEKLSTLEKSECSIIDASGYSATLRELAQNTRYAVCVHVVTTTGRTAQGKVAFFTTGSISVSFAAPAVSYGDDYVTISQSVITDEEIINEGVFYSREVEIPTEHNMVVFDPVVDKNVSVSLMDLQAGRYYIRPFAQVRKDGALFYVYSNVADVNIIGLRQPVPELSGCIVDNVVYSSVNVTASVTNSAICVERGFCYVYGSGTPTIDDNVVTVSGGKPFSAVLQALEPDVDITICAYAISESGVGYSVPITVRTAKKIPLTDDNLFPEM